jgi:beta-lactamase class A
VQCAGSGIVVAGGEERRFTAASTLKAAIVAAALARDHGTVDRRLYALIEPAIVDSSNDAANAVLLRVGAGSPARGTARANALLRRAGMRATRLDGPYRTAAFPGSGPSRKLTTADDLRRLAYLIKAGWLTAVENDLAVAFVAGGPCFVGVTSAGVSLAAASRFTRQVLPALLRAAGR